MIRILARHCNVDNQKPRPAWFDKERCFRNLLDTMDEACDLSVMFDGDPQEHFVRDYPVDVVRFRGGSDAASFRKTLHFAEQQRGGWAPTDIVYFVEDDIWHKPDWPSILREGIGSPHADIISLYDHTDRYKDDAALCRLVFTKTCHWRSAVSTVNTFALEFRTLMEDLDVYRTFANPAASQVCVDHERFLALRRTRGRQLWTSLPAYATHCEQDYLSPVVAWP